MNRTPSPTKYICGLDLGQSTDFSVLSAVRASTRKDATTGRAQTHYAVVHLLRWPLRTSYVQIVADVKKLFNAPVTSGEVNPLSRAALIVDRSGCGRPIYDALLAARVNSSCTIGLSITSGTKNGTETAAKQNLVAGLVRVLGEGRLQVAGGMKLAAELVAEFERFKMKTTPSRNQSFGAEGSDHDDILMSLSLAIHWGERSGVGGTTPPAPYSPRGIASGFQLQQAADARTVRTVINQVMGGGR